MPLRHPRRGDKHVVLTRWRRQRASRLLLDAYMEGLREHGIKSDDDLVIEEFLWRQYGAIKMADMLADTRERARRFPPDLGWPP